MFWEFLHWHCQKFVWRFFQDFPKCFPNLHRKKCLQEILEKISARVPPKILPGIPSEFIPCILLTSSPGIFLPKSFLAFFLGISPTFFYKNSYRKFNQEYFSKFMKQTEVHGRIFFFQTFLKEIHQEFFFLIFPGSLLKIYN